MNDKNSTTPKPSLVGLPLELRNMIYRYLHLNARPIGYPTGARVMDDDFGWDSPRPYRLSSDAFRVCRLSSAAFRVCRQLYDEGSAILYGENIFAFKIWAKYDEERAPFLRGDHIDQSLAMGVPMQKIKRYEIIVEIQSEDEFWPVRSSVRRACQALSDTPGLQQLKISYQFEDPGLSCTRVLEPFALLRNVRSVTFSGVPRRYAQYLSCLMEGSEPLDHLPKMYQALQNFAGPFDHCEDNLQRACEAMEECDSKEFKRIRNDIIESVETHMDFVRGHLFDHDKEIEDEVFGNSSNEQPEWSQLNT